MAKLLHNDVFDGALNIIKNNANIMTACSAQPTTRTEAITTYALADVVMASGDFTVSDGDTNGRKVAVAAKSGVAVDANGTANHIAVCDATRLLLVTTCTDKVLSIGDTVNFPTFDLEMADPT